MSFNTDFLYSLLIYVGIISVIMFTLGFFTTRKYNVKLRNIYFLLLDMNRRKAILFSITYLNLALSFFFLVKLDYFNPIGIYALCITTFVACVFALDYYIIISDIIYTGIVIWLLWSLTTINSYLSIISFDKDVFVLKILMIVMVVIFIIFVAIRESQLIIKNGRKKKKS